MITLTRSLAKQLKTVFRRGLGIPAKSTSTPIDVSTDSSGLHVRARTPDVAVEHFSPGKFTQHHFILPYQVLVDCSGCKQDPIQIERRGDNQVVCGWKDDGIPVVRQYDQLESRGIGLPAAPDVMIENPIGLIGALRDACDTADNDAVRYATNRIQLRGGSGSIAATDGRQLLAQNGFAFPWEEDVLVPRNPVFASRELHTGEPVFMGRSDKWVTVRTGCWTFHLAVDTESRFPRVDDQIPETDATVACLHVSASDAAFLAKAIKRLPGSDVTGGPLTVDLNGKVLLRAKPEEGEQITELLLTNSSCTGQDVCFHTDRRYLARAFSLGFREVQVRDDRTPVYCRDEQRTYVWALLGPSTMIQPSKDAVRIESPSEAGSAQTNKPKNRQNKRKPTVPRTKNEQNGRAAAEPNGEAVTTEKLIEQAEGLRASLRQAVSETGQLITALKRHHKNSKIVRSTLASLRHLQTIENSP